MENNKKGKENHKAAKFLKGMMVGFGAGIAAGMFMSSDKGKELRTNVSASVADFYKHISSKAEEIKDMTESQYKDFMKTAVKQYAKTKNLSKDTADHLLKEVKKSWDHITKNWKD